MNHPYTAPIKEARVLLENGYRVQVLRWATSTGTQPTSSQAATHFFGQVEDGTGTQVFLPKSYIFDPNKPKPAKKNI